MNKRIIIEAVVLIAVFAVGVISGIYAASYPLNNVKETMVKSKKTNYKEADYVNAYCNGQIEVKLPDKTRVDCITDEYAIEFDWGYKWAESVGQSLYYAEMTGKKPAVALIYKAPTDEKYVQRIKKANKNITVFPIKAYADEK